MQTLPIITATPSPAPAQAVASPTQSAAAMDSTAPQPAEQFSKVLARQRANADAQDGKHQAQSTSATPPSNSSAEDTGDAAKVPAADMASTLPGDMLAALLPSTASVTSGKATDEKPSSRKADAKTAAPDSVAVLPGDMLAALTPVPVQPQGVATESSALPIAPAPATRGGVLQPDVLASSRPGKQASALLPASGQSTAALNVTDSTKPAVAPALASAAKPDTFSAMIGASKDAASPVLPGNEKQTVGQAALPDSATLLNQAQGFASALVAASPNAPLQVSLNTPVTQAAWGDEFNQKITWLATQHEQTAELHLNPPQLGPLDVVIKVSGDQATALFTSPHAAVREAVEQALPRLRDMLADSGITLGNAMVSDQSPREQQQAWQAGQQQKGSDGMAGKNEEGISAAGILTGNSVASIRRHQGMVDTFA